MTAQSSPPSPQNRKHVQTVHSEKTVMKRSESLDRFLDFSLAHHMTYGSHHFL